MKPNEILLFDGAMGTYYAELNTTASSKCELANLTNPETILSIHRSYIDAGARAIKTNTFGTNKPLLGADEPEVENVIAAGWKIACEAAAGRAQVFADIGPVPEGPGAEEEYVAVADAFLGLGAEKFLFETLPDFGGLLKAARHIKAARPNAFILASFAVTPDGFTRSGLYGRDIKDAMEASADIDAWGFNCVSGPLYLYDFLSTLGPFKKPVSAMPNAGYPLLEGNRTVYTNSPDYFARMLVKFREAGVTILGGCCGTSPEHIRRAAALLAGGEGVQLQLRHKQSSEKGGEAPSRNLFWEKLQRGEKAIAAEVDPPQDASAEKMLAGAERLSRAGADVITVSDNPLARVRADSSMASSLILRRCGCAVLPHIACRDRNLNAVKSLLLALHIEGVRSVLVVTGDPVAQADRGEVKGVYNSNSSMLAGFVRSLNEGVFAGEPFAIGAALNVNAPNFGTELLRAQGKVERGVRFFLTQPIFSDEALEALGKARSALDAKILAGVMPLASYNNALFVSNEVPGMRVPDALVERFRDLGKEEAERLGAETAGKTVKDALPYADGFYVVTPLGRFRVTETLIAQIRRLTDDQNR